LQLCFQLRDAHFQLLHELAHLSQFFQRNRRSVFFNRCVRLRKNYGRERNDDERRPPSPARRYARMMRYKTYVKAR